MFEFVYLLMFFTLIFTIMVISISNDLDMKLISFMYSIFMFIMCMYMFMYMDFSSVFFYSLTFEFSTIYKMYFTMAIDQLSIPFMILTTTLFVLTNLMAWNSMKFEVKFFYLNLLLLEFFMINVFLAFDLLFFYFWFEATLVPMFLIIVIWGNQASKMNASFYFIFYTLMFTVLFLFMMMYIHYMVGTTNFFLLSYLTMMNKKFQLFFWVSFFLAFAVKLPMFPFHLWLPEAHVEAPTVGSVILASLLLKLGYYGYVSFLVQMCSEMSYMFNSIIVMFCIMGAIYGSFLALSQFDMKKIMAYSSISHMSMCLLGVISNNIYGLMGAFLLAMGHGFVSFALFFLMGFLYDRYHTSILDYYSGVTYMMPIFSFFFFIFMISNFAFPISINFMAEFLVFLGMGYWNVGVLLVLIFYSVLSVAYNLWLYMRMCHGTLFSILIDNKLFYDLSKLELFVMMPLTFFNSFFCFFMENSMNLLIVFFLLMM